MSTDSGSPGLVRTAIPPLIPPWEVMKRATGNGTTSRSRTSIAAAVNALMIARLRVRAARETSREVVTTAPFFRVVA